MDPALFTAWFFELQRAFDPFFNNVFHERDALGADQDTIQSGGKREAVPAVCAVTVSAINLDKFADQSDVFILALFDCFHACDHALGKP
jgi:hypothetical protein